MWLLNLGGLVFHLANFSISHADDFDPEGPWFFPFVVLGVHVTSYCHILSLNQVYCQIKIWHVNFQVQFSWTCWTEKKWMALLKVTSRSYMKVAPWFLTIKLSNPFETTYYPSYCVNTRICVFHYSVTII